MRRRRLLGGLTAGLVGGVAGCLGRSARDESETTSHAGTATRTVVDGVTLPIPESEMRQALPRDHIPAIVDPAFADDWRGLDADGGSSRLPADAPILGVERGGRARAYPLRVLDRHEVVNDEFDGPVAVTYCVLCGSGVVFERRVDGEPTTGSRSQRSSDRRGDGGRTRFGVSGTLWRSDLVMYDERSESLWSQLMATAVRGPRTGERLAVLPSTLSTWGEWQTNRPDTRVLLPPPRSGTIADSPRSFDYFSSKYDYGDESQLVGLDSHDGELHPKVMVVGIESAGVARAYPFPAVVDADVVNDRVGDRPVVVAASPDGTLVAYDRRVDGTTLQFDANDQAHLDAGGSRWVRTTGRAVDGPYEDRVLRRANDQPPMFWKGWSNFNPGTEVYATDRVEA